MKHIYSIVSERGSEKHIFDKWHMPSFNNHFLAYFHKDSRSADTLDILYRLAKGEFSVDVDLAFEKYLNRLIYNRHRRFA